MLPSYTSFVSTVHLASNFRSPRIRFPAAFCGFLKIDSTFSVTFSLAFTTLGVGYLVHDLRIRKPQPPFVASLAAATVTTALSNHLLPTSLHPRLATAHIVTTSTMPLPPGSPYTSSQEVEREEGRRLCERCETVAEMRGGIHIVVRNFWLPLTYVILPHSTG